MKNICRLNCFRYSPRIVKKNLALLWYQLIAWAFVEKRILVQVNCIAKSGAWVIPFQTPVNVRIFQNDANMEGILRNVLKDESFDLCEVELCGTDCIEWNVRLIQTLFMASGDFLYVIAVSAIYYVESHYWWPHQLCTPYSLCTPQYVLNTALVWR